MIQTTQRLEAKHLFTLFLALYILSMFLPSYLLPAITVVEDPNLKPHTLLYGYQCYVFALMNMFDNPVPFMGSLSNIMIVILLIVKLLQIPGPLKALKSVAVVVCIVSPLIWPIFMGIGLHVGYYVWTIATIGIAIGFALQKPIEAPKDESILDDSISNNNL